MSKVIKEKVIGHLKVDIKDFEKEKDEDQKLIRELNKKKKNNNNFNFWK